MGRIEIPGGRPIDLAIDDVRAHADATGESAVGEFNGFDLRANPGDSFDDVALSYDTEMRRRARGAEAKERDCKSALDRARELLSEFNDRHERYLYEGTSVADLVTALAQAIGGVRSYTPK